MIPIAIGASLFSSSGCSATGGYQGREFNMPGNIQRGEPHITNEESLMIGNWGYVRNLGFGRVEDFKWHEVYETPRESQIGLDRLYSLRRGDYSW